MSETTFPEIKLTGNADELGLQHGDQLAHEIENTVEFYGQLFGRRQQEIFEYAKHFKRLIDAFNPDYIIEIEALAAAAGINPYWIYALNSRSEILNSLSHECTAIYFQPTALLGQNWDWSPTLEGLIRVVHIQANDGPDIRMISEPGIIGKIGMNSEGLGVCLNILSCNKPANGVPIHILLRAILDSSSLEQANRIIDRAPNGKASNILMGDDRGDSLDIEFAGDRLFKLPHTRVPLHTNHYLGEAINSRDLLFESSFARYERAQNLIKRLKHYDLDEMKSLLLDQTQAQFSICSPYHASDLLGESGTVCTLIMDLKRRAMHLKRGNNVQSPFSTYSL